MQGCTPEWRTNFQREATTRDSKRGQSGNTVIRDPRILCIPLSKFLDPPLRAHNLFQNNWKGNLFSQNWSDNDAKKIGYKISTIILFAPVGDKMTKIGTADPMKCASKIYF